jgi:hypothetical protein
MQPQYQGQNDQNGAETPPRGQRDTQAPISASRTPDVAPEHAPRSKDCTIPEVLKKFQHDPRCGTPRHVLGVRPGFGDCTLLRNGAVGAELTGGGLRGRRLGLEQHGAHDRTLAGSGVPGGPTVAAFSERAATGSEFLVVLCVEATNLALP